MTLKTYTHSHTQNYKKKDILVEAWFESPDPHPSGPLFAPQIYSWASFPNILVSMGHICKILR